MKNALSLTWMLPILVLSFTTTAQINYPYNPDGNADSLIGVYDLQDMLSGYGQPFVVEGIMVDSMSLEAYLQMLLNRIGQLEAQLDAGAVHGTFDSSDPLNADGYFVVPAGVSMVTIYATGTSGGQGGGICGMTANYGSCNLCNAGGGGGGQAVTATFVLGNLQQGDTLSLGIVNSGADSDDLITCSPGFNGWNGWGCGPADSGQPGESCTLALNNTPLLTLLPGQGGFGACIGCQGDGCYNGAAGAAGNAIGLADFIDFEVTSAGYVSTSRLIIRY